MKPDDILKLVELTDRLVYSQTGQHLEPVEKEILLQTLTGKKNSDIKFPDLSNSYVQRRCAPKLWNQLSVVIGQKVHKRNVLEVLQSIQLQRTQSKALSQTQYTGNAGTDELNGRAAQNGFLSYSQGKYGIKSDDSYQYDREYHLCQQGSTGLDPIEQHRNDQQNEQSGTLPAEDSNHKTVSDNSPDSTSQEFQQSATTSSHENADTKNSIYDLLSFINIKQPGVPLLLSIGALGCSFGLSWLANWYGLTRHWEGQLPQAQLAYKIALRLNPWSAEAHYNQAVAYEDKQNYERAYAEYQMAIEGGLIEAYNNQARLYILEGNYDAAVSLVRVGLPLAQDDRVRADMYKNRGWARLEQGHLALAKIALQESIKLKSDRAPAYCLMAQVLERSGNEQVAPEYWFKCLGFSYQPETPEEDKWIELARQRLSPRNPEK